LFENLIPVQIRHHQVEQDQTEFFLLISASASLPLAAQAIRS